MSQQALDRHEKQELVKRLLKLTIEANQLKRILSERDLNEPLSIEERLAQVGTPEGKDQLEKVLTELPFPHFAVDASGALVKIEASGQSTQGRFVGREFVAWVS